MTVQSKTPLIEYTYNLPDEYSTISKTPGFILTAVLVTAAALFFVTPILTFITLFILIMSSATRARGRNVIIMSDRYLIFGTKILYWRSVKELKRGISDDQLLICMKNGDVCSIELDRFHTNARKPHKVRANREKKYRKVCTKITERVERAKTTEPETLP